MRTYKLFIQEYDLMVDDYITREETIKTNDIYHEIGKIYCQSLVKIKRIDYLEITKDLEQEIERLHSIIKEVREIFKYYGVKEDIVGYSNYTITGEDLLKLLSILDKVGE